jgi:hypothetical protein
VTYKDVGFGLATAFIGHKRLQFLITICDLTVSLFHTACLQFTTHALDLLGLLPLHQSSGTSLQRRTFPFPGSLIAPVPQP